MQGAPGPAAPGREVPLPHPDSPPSPWSEFTLQYCSSSSGFQLFITFSSIHSTIPHFLKLVIHILSKDKLQNCPSKGQQEEKEPGRQQSRWLALHPSHLQTHLTHPAEALAVTSVLKTSHTRPGPSFSSKQSQFSGVTQSPHPRATQNR